MTPSGGSDSVCECECCEEEATHFDSEGMGFCDGCWEDLIDAQIAEEADL